MSVFLNASSFEGPGSSFAIPYNTLRGVSTELVDVKEGLDRMKVQMVSALLATIFIGEPSVHLTLFTATAHSPVCAKKESTPLVLRMQPKCKCASASHK